MSEPTREVNLVPDFLDGLFEIQQFAGRASAGAGRRVVQAILDFAYDIIALSPRAFPVYPTTRHSEREYRRAVFRKKFVLIYRIADQELTFLVVHSTRQDSSNLQLPD